MGGPALAPVTEVLLKFQRTALAAWDQSFGWFTTLQSDCQAMMYCGRGRLYLRAFAALLRRSAMAGPTPAIFITGNCKCREYLMQLISLSYSLQRDATVCHCQQLQVQSQVANPIR